MGLDHGSVEDAGGRVRSSTASRSSVALSAKWSDYILGSAIEVARLAGIAYDAWTWPKTPETAASGLGNESASHLAR